MMGEPEEARTRAERNSVRVKLWSEVIDHVKRPLQKNAPLVTSTEPEVYFPLELWPKSRAPQGLNGRECVNELKVATNVPPRRR